MLNAKQAWEDWKNVYPEAYEALKAIWRLRNYTRKGYTQDYIKNNPDKLIKGWSKYYGHRKEK